MKSICAVLLTIPMLIWAVLSIAAVQVDGSPGPSWFEHVDLMQTIIAALFGAVLWLMIRTLKKIDVNQARLFERLDLLCSEFYTLRGEHNAIKERCQKSSR